MHYSYENFEQAKQLAPEQEEQLASEQDKQLASEQDKYLNPEEEDKSLLTINYKYDLNIAKKELIKLLTAALSFVTALAWNTAFQNFFQNNPYLNLYGPWIYAILITIIAIIAILNINKLR